MLKTKKQVIKEMIEVQSEELLKMEIVKEYQGTLDTPEAKKQVDAAEKRIEDIVKQLAWLKAK